MQIKIILLSALVAVLITEGTSIDQNTFKRKPIGLDVIKPLLRIKEAYDKNVKDQFKIFEVLSLLLDVITDCALPSLFQEALATTKIEMLTTPFNTKISLAQLQLLEEELSSLPQPSIPNFMLRDICENNTEKAFQEIHQFIWGNGQLTDLVHFLGEFGYGSIYDHINILYTNCSPDQKKILPTPRPPTNKSRELKNHDVSISLPNIREEILQSRKSELKETQAANCGLIQILQKLAKHADSHLYEFGKFFVNVTIEFKTDPNLHFLIGKLQEPIKGKSVREFRNIKPMQGVIKGLHEKLKGDALWKQVFAVIKHVTNVDFTVLNPYNFIISLLEYLVWGTAFQL